MQWGTVPAWVAAAISVIFGIQSWRSSRKSKTEREEATRQAERAERAVSAAETAASAAERSAGALETQASIASEQVAAEELKPWVLEPVLGSDNTILRNRTATVKYGVRMEGTAVRVSDIGTVDGYGAVEVDTLRRIWNRDRRVTVTWYWREDKSDTPLSWTAELPRDYDNSASGVKFSAADARTGWPASCWTPPTSSTGGRLNPPGAEGCRTATGTATHPISGGYVGVSRCSWNVMTCEN